MVDFSGEESDRVVPRHNAQRESWARSCTKRGERQAIAEIPKGSIGDIASNERGSGARYNGGKSPVELIPVWIIAEYEETRIGRSPVLPPSEVVEAMAVLDQLGEWQRGERSLQDVMAEFDESLGDPLAECAAVFDYGRKKYAEWNWAKGMPWSVPLACAVRHLRAIIRGEHRDPESGLSHRGHVLCNVVMLVQFEANYREGDDLPTHWLQVPKGAPIRSEA